MTNKKCSPNLNAWTFFASAHAIDVCGINGLPLTPNSIRILGRFQKLKLLTHPRLCAYLDVQRGKHERIMIVSEHFKENFSNQNIATCLVDRNLLTRHIRELLAALNYLHQHSVVHRCISPSTVHFDAEGHIKLCKYGLYYMTEGGSTVSFPIGDPKYMAPEVLAHGIIYSSSSPKCDIWSLGIIFLEIIMEASLWDEYTLEEIFKEIVSLLNYETGHDVVSCLIKTFNSSTKYENCPASLQSFIEDCLHPSANKRPDARQLLFHALFEDHTDRNIILDEQPLKFLSTQLRCTEYNGFNKNIAVIDDHLYKRPLQELYYLWQLAGGDLGAELRRQELIKAKPPIVTISKIIVCEGEEFGHEKDRAYLLDNSVSVLPTETLKYRLRDVDNCIYYPLIEYSVNCVSPSGASYRSNSVNAIKETAKLPLLIKEKDVEYQLHRIILFKRLLEAYPYKRTQILHEAKIDIPPLYRSWVWASLLEIEGDIQAAYDGIDKETPTPTDRQIEVDIPRCHQYDEFLSSPVGHRKFKRILKAWVVSHPEYVYWQGLDSLCAPFLSLNFNNEALAYACLSAFIPKYLHNFFLKDNSSVIQEYLAKFSHLIAFHDPELTNHLDSIGFIPELYAIPWFLTMYTHVFPLHKIFHLWDTLLYGPSSFPLCIGVAILKQLRNNLLSYGFNECILMFSDMPEIDIQRCVQDSIRVFCGTPKSITYRVHENTDSKLPKLMFETIFKSAKSDSILDSDLIMKPIPVQELKSEVCPRISAEDLLDLLARMPEARNRSRSSSIKLLVVDVRSNEEYCRGSLQHSINVPYVTAFNSDGTLENSIIRLYKGKFIVIIGSCKDKFSSEFSKRLVRLGYSHVCTLHGGVESLRKTGLLVAKTFDN